MVKNDKLLRIQRKEDERLRGQQPDNANDYNFVDDDEGKKNQPTQYNIFTVLYIRYHTPLNLVSFLTHLRLLANMKSNV